MEGGEQILQQIREERILRPVRRIGDFRQERFEQRELCSEGLPAGSEGGYGESRGEEAGEE